MADETIEPVLYRTGSADRSLALSVSLALTVCVPVFWWASGPLLWPWGFAAMFFVGIWAGVAFSWWRQAAGSVLWVPKTSSLEFRRKGTIRVVALRDLTRIEVCPSEVVTRLEEGTEVFRLSHRLVGVEGLLDRLRDRRPDLFPRPRPPLTLRVSSVGAAATLTLAVATLAAGLILGFWLPPLGGIFLAGATLVLGRVLFLMPRSFVVGPGTLTQIFWLRRKTWTRATGCDETVYPAGGSVFFRMRFDFGARNVVLDEGFLIDPLKPAADWIREQLSRAEEN